MARIVQKFGGTSVGDVERIRKVADRVRRTRDEGHEVVVVVSARSGVTNELISRAKALNPNPNEREMDLLLAVGEQETIALTTMALHSLGIPAVSRTGAQAGILTDPAHTRARILEISGGDIDQQLKNGSVVIVAGFQGANVDGQTTTLGRGGSDLSAIAIAAALNADLCQIYTDVEGVFTADPRIVPDARKLDEIAYEEMLELASSGSKVMQTRAVKFAQKYGVRFEVRSSFNDKPGTIVKEEVVSMEDVAVSGVALDRNQVKIVISDIPDRPGTAARIFQALSEEGVLVDMIVQNLGREGRANLTFTVPEDDAFRAENAVKALKEDFPEAQISTYDRIAKLSAVGVGMRSHTGVAGKLFRALAEKKINVQMISTSEIKISVVIGIEDAEEAVRTLHAAFGLAEDSSKE
ncbi:aspartate kinase [Puniceicoccus vermicola]|uniref:Aspartokinase n=1 Tax=Puniceicoccus vermicola TaxID=388746 RepID=A0A7X1E6R1_9BACT|nr:aspartate kinase [Puniceicoccus vermicola]MBC2604353.1 aspartate kinase [Puniceicoccus vermicola]